MKIFDYDILMKLAAGPSYDSEFDRFGVDLPKGIEKELDKVYWDDKSLKSVVEKYKGKKMKNPVRAVIREYSPDTAVRNGFLTDENVKKLGGKQKIKKLLMTIIVNKKASQKEKDKLFSAAFKNPNAPVQVFTDSPDFPSAHPNEIQFYWGGMPDWGRDFSYAGEGPGLLMRPNLYYDVPSRKKLKKLLLSRIAEAEKADRLHPSPYSSHGEYDKKSINLLNSLEKDW